MNKILLMAASLRIDSCNKKLSHCIFELAKTQDIDIEELNFSDFTAPLYDGDLEEDVGLPSKVNLFVDKLNNADGLIITSPEYNFSTSGTLKNLIDWVSRAKPRPWVNYPVMLCSASPSLVGGSRGLLHTTTVLQSCCGAYVFPKTFSLPDAYQAFSNDGSLKDHKFEERLAENIAEFVEFIDKLGSRKL